MKTRLVGFLAFIVLVLSTSLPKTVFAGDLQKRAQNPTKVDPQALQKVEREKLAPQFNKNDKGLFEPIPGLILKRSECAPGEISSPRSWDIGSGDSGGTICVPRCGSHYEFIPYDPDNHENVCNEFAGSDSGSVSSRRIVGGYTCRFLNDYYPPDTCPKGTFISANSAYDYSCHSSSPISKKLGSCIEGFTPYDYTDTYSGTSPEYRYGFSCNREEGTHEICSDPDALWIGGAGIDRCCAYLGSPK